MPGSLTCDFCHQPNNQILGIEEEADLAINEKRHRSYSITTNKELRKILLFLYANIDGIVSHVHFLELSHFCDQNEVLDWTQEQGRYVEAIFHLALDTHWDHCEVTSDAACNKLQVSIDHGAFKSFSRSEDCRTCRRTGVYASRNDANEAGDVYRIGNFQLIKNPIRTCTLQLSLLPGPWPEQGGRCNLCNSHSLTFEELIMGRENILNAYLQWNRCACKFKCIDY